jgi:hypothetical protein
MASGHKLQVFYPCNWYEKPAVVLPEKGNTGNGAAIKGCTRDALQHDPWMYQRILIRPANETKYPDELIPNPRGPVPGERPLTDMPECDRVQPPGQQMGK